MQPTDTAYDPGKCERLIRELREDDAEMTPPPWFGGADCVSIRPDGRHVVVAEMDLPERHEANASGIARTRNNLRALANQLDAARREIGRLGRLDAIADPSNDRAPQDFESDRHLDRCAFCMGMKGGELGKEDNIQGVLACRPCSELVMDIIQATLANAVQAPPPELMDGSVHNDACAEVGALVRGATDTAREHERQEKAGELVSLVAPFGGTVTDPDELAMYEEMKQANITVCPKCRNTGWSNGEVLQIIGDAAPHCDCPVGRFLAKKTIK